MSNVTLCKAPLKGKAVISVRKAKLSLLRSARRGRSDFNGYKQRSLNTNDSDKISIGDVEEESKQVVDGMPLQFEEPLAIVPFKKPQPETTLVELLLFTLPTMAIWLASPVLSLVDATVVGSRSVTELAALTPGTVIVDYVSYIFTFLGIATTNLLSVAVAKKDKELTQTRLNDALALAIGCGVVLGCLIFACNGSLFPLVIDVQSQELVAPASTYASIRALGIPFALIGMVLQCAFLAAKNTRVPLIATVAAGMVNLVGDLIMVNVMGHGIAGAAWATVFSQILSVGVLWAYLGKKFAGMPYKFQMRVPEVSSLLKFISIAGPVSIILMSKVVVFSTVSLSAANLGAIGSAAHALLFNIFLFFCVPGDALNQCAQTFLPPVRGKTFSERRLKNKLLLAGNAIGIGNCLIGGTVLFFFPQLLTRSEPVMSAIKNVALMVATILFLHPFGIATEGILMASQHFEYLLGTYILNMACMLGLVKMLTSTGPTLSKVWLSLVFMQVLRLVANSLKLVPELKKKPPVDMSVSRMLQQ